MTEPSPRGKYRKYLKNQEEDEEVIENIYQGNQVHQKVLKWNVITPQEKKEQENNEKGNNENKESKKRQSSISKIEKDSKKNIDGLKLVNGKFCDKHWDFFKDVLDFYYPNEDFRKYHAGILPISSYMEKPKSAIILGECNEKLIKGILKIYPDEHVLRYMGINDLDLFLEDWKGIKLAYFVFFEENKDLIYNKYMRNIEDFKIRIRKGSKIIPNITVLATSLKSNLPSRFKPSSNIIELSNLEKDIEDLVKFELFKQGHGYEYHLLKKPVKEKIARLNTHFRELDREFLVEISWDDILQDEVNLNESILPFEAFLDLIKYITFFHQKKREWYEDKNSGKRYLISHYNDFIHAYLIAMHFFTSPLSNLKPAKLAFFNYLIEMAEKKRRGEKELKNLSMHDIQLEQTKIVDDYPGKRSTLYFWLNEFSNKLRLLVKIQPVKGGKVYYSLNKIAPLKPNRFEDLLEKIQRSYKRRIEELKKIESKSNTPIIFHPIDQGSKDKGGSAMS
ncbi:MAG: hypothetical protein HWN66_00945 [Candidatus Helarchaeota archaeon]|nr:hypothetical protein [Candidatus Helarchaeota archaeon]